MARLRTSSHDDTLRFRPPRTADGATLWALAKDNRLDENSPYAYLMWAEYFSESTVVATTADDDTAIGFVMAFRRPDERDTVFVWQVGVSSDHRRRGIAGALLDHLVEQCGATHLEATVTPDNLASRTLFQRFGARHGAPVTVEDSLFAATEFPAGHDAEDRFRIGPLGPVD